MALQQALAREIPKKRNPLAPAHWRSIAHADVHTPHPTRPMRPLLKSAIACRISASLFITNGP